MVWERAGRLAGLAGGRSGSPLAHSVGTCLPQRRIAQWKLSGQGTERYYFSGIARATKKMPQSHLVWYSDAN